MVKCFICKEEIKENNNRHIYYCAKINKVDKSKNDLRYEQISFRCNRYFTKEEINLFYVKEKYSLPDFRENFGLFYGETQFLVKYFGFNLRNISKANKSKRKKEKFEETSLIRYGCKNPSSNIDVKKKREKTFIDKYGVDNIRKSDWFKDQHKIYMQNTYGVGSLPNRNGNMQIYWDSKTEEEKQKHMLPANIAYLEWYNNLSEVEKDTLNQKKVSGLIKASSSKIEESISNSLINLKISFKTQYWIKMKSYDFKINDPSFLIEVNGDYWHANPLIYCDNDVIKYPDRTICAADRWKEDKEKIKSAEEYGYSVLTLWESDIRENLNTLDIWLNNKIEKHVNVINSKI
jgi:G:T-mismatch repair DNA endonuclease (very short patch repair protein)